MNEQHMPTGPGGGGFSKKMCPLRVADNSVSTQFMPCLLDLCAWCRQKEITVGGVKKGVFYCGIAGDKF